MNSLFSNSNQQMPTNLNPLQIMQEMQNYQGTPEQAKEEFYKKAQAMGMDSSQINNTLEQIKNLGRTLGIF